jgi:hypothetical protein
MMVNGKTLCAVFDNAPTNGNSPASFYEYDYSSGSLGSFAQVNSPTGGLTENTESIKMLDLPDGTVLYSDFTEQLYLYQPTGSPLAWAKPTISSLSTNADGSYHLTGTLFNGISQGAVFGDDAQMDSNYPLVRLSDFQGNVYYARTFNWSSTSVMTSNRVVTTEFALPSGFPPGNYSLVVVANGLSSDRVSLILPRTITSFSDNGPGSLRNAVTAAGPGEIINFTNGLAGVITLTSGVLTISNDLTILGPGAEKLAIDGNYSDEVFRISGGTVLISGLTITNGLGNINGGGLYNQGTVTLSNCMVCGNASVIYGGGGLWNDGIMNIIGCTIYSNTAGYYGGGGGGIYNNVGYTMTISNSTVFGNSATNFGGGGGIFNAGPLTITACTIASNLVDSGASGVGGGIQNWNGNPTLLIMNTIVAGNSSSSITNPDVNGVFTSRGYNLIGITNGSSGWSPPRVLGDQRGALSAPIDPKLGPLQDNGGPTLTMALLFTSPALDKGNSFGLGSDQRGRPRPHELPSFTKAAGGDGSDIGAYELVPPALNLSVETNVVLSWSATESGYTVLGSPSLSPPVWTPLSGTPAVLGPNFVLTNAATTNKFFRLRAP